MNTNRPLFVLLLAALLCCFGAQAATLDIKVIDAEDDSAIRDVSLYADGEYIGKTGSKGTFSYTHSAEKSFRLVAGKTGYEEWSRLIGRYDTSVLVELERKSETLTVELIDPETVRPVAGALVRVSGEDYDRSRTTDSRGRADFSVKTGLIYNVEISRQGYYPLTQTVDMGDGGRAVQYWFYRSDAFAVRVRDAATGEAVAGASVFVDNAPAGTTDAEGVLMLHLKRERTYAFRVERTDYQPYQSERLIGTEDVLLEPLLSKSSYPVTISVFDEQMRPVEGAEISINGSIQGKTNSYGRYALSSIEAGTYAIAVKAPGYLDWEETQQITESGEEVVAELAFGEADVTFVAMAGGDRPVPGATVLIDGEAAGTTDAEGRLTIPLKTAITYAVSVQCDGYHPAAAEEVIPLGAAVHTVTIGIERVVPTDTILIGAAAIVVAAALLVWYRRRRSRRSRISGRRNL